MQQKDKQILELQDELYEARQKAITAQEEVQAKTAQVKQYKKKDDQREEKVHAFLDELTSCLFLVHNFIAVISRGKC